MNIDAILTAAPQAWATGAPLATLACLLLLGGAVGKSAQLPLQTWLPDAMAGPTPVSALIHAATMVTAGVYLIARMEPLFALSPFALECVGAIGAITLLLAGFTALMQTDIKKILAYSTMSQIGYMFLAEGVGAYDSAMFHLMTHAFFKALLFLSAGSVILAMHHEQDIFKMGGLRTRLPFAFASMLIGTLALTAFPFTSGYYSKDEILHQAYLTGHHDLWLAGLLGAFLTALYSFRLIFVVFFGPERWKAAGSCREPHPGHGLSHHIPLAVLGAFALAGGLIHLPLGGVLPEAHAVDEASGLIEHLPLIASLAGIAVSWLLFMQAPQVPAAPRRQPGDRVARRVVEERLGIRLDLRPPVRAPLRVPVSDHAQRSGRRRDESGAGDAERPEYPRDARRRTGNLRWYARRCRRRVVPADRWS